MGRRFNWLLTCAAMCSLLVLGTVAFYGQEPVAEPLTEEQVLSLVTSSKLGELSAERIVGLIKKRRVQFSITDGFLLELQAREADPIVVETLRNAPPARERLCSGAGRTARAARSSAQSGAKRPCRGRLGQVSGMGSSQSLGVHR